MLINGVIHAATVSHLYWKEMIKPSKSRIFITSVYVSDYKMKIHHNLCLKPFNQCSNVGGTPIGGGWFLQL